MKAAAEFVVESPDVVYGPEAIEAQYEYRTTGVSREGGVLKVGEGRRGAVGMGELRSREGLGIAPRLQPRRCSEGERAWDPGLIAPPFHRCAPRPRASPSGPPGRCPGSGSCLSAGAGTTAPRSPPPCWPTDCVCPGPRAPAARWGVGRGSAGVRAGGGGASRGGAPWRREATGGGVPAGRGLAAGGLLGGLAGAEPKVSAGSGEGRLEGERLPPGLGSQS